MFRRSLVVLALLAAPSAAQPDAGCTSELIALVQAGATSPAACTALAAFEACISRVEDRPTQSNLEIELSAKQETHQGCAETPMTAAIRTERDAVAVTGRQILFHRTVRQTVNIHELQEQANINAGNISSMAEEVSNAIVASQSTTTAQIAAAASNQIVTLNSELSSIRSTMTSTIMAMVASQSTAAAGVSTTVQSLNASVQQAVIAANSASSPEIYIQWGARRCTAAAGVSVVKLYDGVMYGSRHNRQSSANQLCLKNAAGAQGGVNQGGRESNDVLVPIRKEHSNYNQMPSAGNVWRAREGYVIPCSKCKYHKSCFMETGVASCPSGYHQMYTGYMHGEHDGHPGNNLRVCLDKNPTSADYVHNSNWGGHLYPSLVKDGSGAGPRNGNYVPACHMCCAH